MTIDRRCCWTWSAIQGHFEKCLALYQQQTRNGTKATAGPCFGSQSCHNYSIIFIINLAQHSWSRTHLSWRASKDLLPVSDRVAALTTRSRPVCLSHDEKTSISPGQRNNGWQCWQRNLQVFSPPGTDLLNSPFQKLSFVWRWFITKRLHQPATGGCDNLPRGPSKKICLNSLVKVTYPSEASPRSARSWKQFIAVGAQTSSCPDFATKASSSGRPTQLFGIHGSNGNLLPGLSPLISLSERTGQQWWKKTHPSMTLYQSIILLVVFFGISVMRSKQKFLNTSVYVGNGACKEYYRQRNGIPQTRRSFRRTHVEEPNFRESANA